jgi:hypothetical protein
MKSVMKKQISFFLLLFFQSLATAVAAQYTVLSSAPDANSYKNGIDDGQYVRDKFAYDKAWKDMMQNNMIGMEITNLVALDNIRRSFIPKMTTLVKTHKVVLPASFKYAPNDYIQIAQNAKATGLYNNNQLFSIQVNTQLAYFAYYESTPNSGLEYYDLASIAAYYIYKSYYFWQGQNVNPNTPVLQKVYQQIQKKFLETPSITKMTSLQKQEFAETMLFRTSTAAEAHDAGGKNNPLKNKNALDNLKHIYGEKGVQLKITDAGIVFDESVKADMINQVIEANTNTPVKTNKIKPNSTTVYNPSNSYQVIIEAEKNGMQPMQRMLLQSNMAIAYSAYKQVMQEDLENFNDVAGAMTFIICLNYSLYHQVQEIPTPHVEKVYNQLVAVITADNTFGAMTDAQKQLLTETMVLDAVPSIEAAKLNDKNKLKEVCMQYLKKYLGNRAGRLRIDANGMNF